MRFNSSRDGHEANAAALFGTASVFHLLWLRETRAVRRERGRFLNLARGGLIPAGTSPANTPRLIHYEVTASMALDIRGLPIAFRRLPRASRRTFPLQGEVIRSHCSGLLAMGLVTGRA